MKERVITSTFVTDEKLNEQDLIKCLAETFLKEEIKAVKDEKTEK